MPLFVELCAGTAALSVRLQGGKHARPPVSRMGAKTGYADCILRIMGLRPGQGAAQYLWCEPDAGVRLLLEAYRDHALALAAADIISGWAEEDPRTLWERLKAEGAVKQIKPREVARWCFSAACAMKGNPVAGYAIGEGCNTVWAGGSPQLSTAGRLSTIPTFPATIHPDALQIDPREVARWCLVEGWTSQGRYMGPDRPSSCHSDTWTASITRQGMSKRLQGLCAFDSTICTDALQVDPQQLPPGCVVYIDPPYEGTTGYADDLPRAQVLALALKWSQAGAAVYISEAVPLDLPGWHHINITAERKGQKRTFSKQQREFITCNVLPAWVPAVQEVLF